jgi:hypothetical protein
LQAEQLRRVKEIQEALGLVTNCMVAVAVEPVEPEALLLYLRQVPLEMVLLSLSLDPTYIMQVEAEAERQELLTRV